MDTQKILGIATITAAAVITLTVIMDFDDVEFECRWFKYRGRKKRKDT
ncbi:hypothetical protein [Thalassotalea sp. PS06]|nr:hypothetical protein [Thalassotalea sp. PS06]